MASIPLDDLPDADSFDFTDEAGDDASAVGDPNFGEIWSWLAALSRREAGASATGKVGAQVLDPPRIVGKFRLDAVVGAGGYGAVFRAFDTELGRFCALKIAWPHIMYGRVTAARFIAEAKAIASLAHPGIVAVFDADWIGPFYAIELELIEGPSLAEWLKGQDRVPFDVVARIVAMVADAVHYAHAKEIVHRDLKPSNILLRPVAGASAFPFEPLVTDFGLAHRPPASEGSSLTQAHEAIGTAPYISPEHLDGSGVKPTATSDVFSLGVILYELITGRRPFQGESSIEIATAVRADDPLPFRYLRTKIPRDLETITAKCLEKLPERRYPTAQALAEDLRRFVEHRPIRARPASPLRRGWCYPKRRPGVVALVAVALVFASLIGAWTADRRSAARQLAAVDAIERQQRYVANIQQAAEALRHGRRRDVQELLEQCRSLAREPVRCGLEWEVLRAQLSECHRSFKGHDGNVHSVRFSPRGDLLVSAGEDGRTIFWNTTSWTKRAEFQDGIPEVNVAEISADGGFLAVAGDDGRVVVRRVNDGSVIFDKRVMEGAIFALAWLGDARQFAVGGDGPFLAIIDPDADEWRRSAPLLSVDANRTIGEGHIERINALAWVPERKAIAVGATPRTLFLMDAVSLETLRSWDDELAPKCICHIPLGLGYLAARCGEPGNPAIWIWSTQDGSKVAEIAIAPFLTALRFSSGAGALMAGFRNGAIQTWDMQSILDGQKPYGPPLCAQTDRVSSVDGSPDGSWMASAGWDGQVKLWQATGEKENELPNGHRPWSVGFSPCGRWMVMLSSPQEVHAPNMTVFDAHSGRKLWTKLAGVCHAHAPPQTLDCPIAFDPTGEEIAYVTAECCVHRCVARTGERRKAHSFEMPSRATRLQYSADGATLTVQKGTIYSADNTKVIPEPQRTYDSLVIDRTSNATTRYPEGPAGHFGPFQSVRGEIWLHRTPDRELLIRTAPLGPIVFKLEGFAEQVSIAAVSPDGCVLAVSGDERIVYTWNLNHGGRPWKFIGHEGRIVDLAFSADGRTLLSYGFDGTVRFWDVGTQAELLRLGSADERIICLALDPTGCLLVFGVERDGRFALRVHRLGPNRDALPKNFDLSEVDKQTLPKDERPVQTVEEK